MSGIEILSWNRNVIGKEYRIPYASPTDLSDLFIVARDMIFWDGSAVAISYAGNKSGDYEFYQMVKYEQMLYADMMLKKNVLLEIVADFIAMTGRFH